MSHVQRYAEKEEDCCNFTPKNGGRCSYEKLEGSLYCAMHSETRNPIRTVAAYKNRLDTYRLSQWHQRLTEIKDSSQFRTIVDEIGIIRLTLEAILNQCKDETDLLIHSARIGDLTDKVGKQMVMLNRMEKQSGLLLDKSAVIAMGGRIVEIIAQYVKEPSLIEAIANDIFDTIQNAQSIEED